MRGLKLHRGKKVKSYIVASFTDAWIETLLCPSFFLQLQVASFTDAWIETLIYEGLENKPEVASFTDAWIETIYFLRKRIKFIVASFTDAWIETLTVHLEKLLPMSHLLQMRGLKPPVTENMVECESRIFYRCVD